MQIHSTHDSKKAEQAFEQFLEVLPSEYGALAYEFKAFERARKVRNPQELLRIVFSFCGLDLAIRKIAAAHTLLFETISDTAILKRLEACQPWVKALLQQMLQLNRNMKVELPEGMRVFAIDASVLHGLAPTAIDARMHVSIDLITLSFVELLITDSHTGETLKNFALQKGDIALVDQGYCHHLGILHARKSDAHVIGRLNARNLRLLEPDGEKFCLRTALGQHQSYKPVSFEVLISGKSGERPVQAWIHAQKVPDRLKRQLQDAYHKKKKGEHKIADPFELYLKGWFLVYSTIPPEVLSGKACLALYRHRWQIELVFKRCKSLLDLDKMRMKKDSANAHLWIHGKMLYTMCLDSHLRKKLGEKWGWMYKERKGSFWRGTGMLVLKSISQILSPQHWKDENWPQAIQVLTERTRKRKLQHFDSALNPLLKLLSQKGYFP